MHRSLKISVGQHSSPGKKPLNQDWFDVRVPNEPQLSHKGIAVAIADGISSSSVSQIASKKAVDSFVRDYYSTSDAWSVRTSGIQVVKSINGWLSAKTHKSDYRFDKDKGYVCTLSALILKGRTAHIFHVGDSRIFHIRKTIMEQLTKDHRSWTSSKSSYLSRALGVHSEVEVDYSAVTMQEGDYFVLCTDGVYEHCLPDKLLGLLESTEDQLDETARAIVSHALDAGSDDNLSVQLIKIEALAHQESSILQQQIEHLAIPPLLKAKQLFDGYEILRVMQINSRSHVYLAKDIDDNAKVVIKAPSGEYAADKAYLERFMMEEWTARRINSAHVVKAASHNRERHFLYSATQYIEGLTLRQWLTDQPNPSLESVRDMAEQIAKGLHAIHREEIIHQDLRQDNVMIDSDGMVKIIDLGGAYIAGIKESLSTLEQADMQGTALYMAPEYFIGADVSERSDQFSLAVIVYHMLSGRFPYGTSVSKARSVSAQKRLIYQPVLDDEREIPVWLDFALRKALHPNPYKRYAEISEFVHDLRQPNPKFLRQSRPPLIQRKPLLFWKTSALVLFISVLGLLIYIQKISA